MIGVKRTLVSMLVGMLLVATAIASLWLMAASGVFTGEEAPLPQAPGGNRSAFGSAQTDALLSGQVDQPRDPFEPLITAPPSDGPTGTTEPGDGTTTTAPGGTTSTTTTPGGTTTSTTTGDAPGTTRVTLLEVREEGGVLIAVVEVDGETFTVGVGDTFADSFKVIDLTESGGVFTFGDSAFTLSVGQSILK